MSQGKKSYSTSSRKQEFNSICEKKKIYGILNQWTLEDRQTLKWSANYTHTANFMSPLSIFKIISFITWDKSFTGVKESKTDRVKVWDKPEHDWCGRGSNQEPQICKSCALPAEVMESPYCSFSVNLYQSILRPFSVGQCRVHLGLTWYWSMCYLALLCTTYLFALCYR